MTIGTIQNGNYNNGLLNQINQRGLTNPAGDVDGNVLRIGSMAQGSVFASAVGKTLAGMGVTAAAVTTSGSASAGGYASAQSPQQALSAFMQSLFAAFQAQSGSVSQNGQAAGSANAASGVLGISGHHFHHGGGMEAKLQSLIQQLSSTASSGSGSPSSANTALQQSYQGLLSAQGASGNPASLSGFLQALAQNIQGVGSAGNAVNMQV